ncbi:hypothetical protein GF357_03205 [Candidatus Dojkabacteria bacterium]|nr:hypothetical protein [Candidatus Dojkabacteria bacterium]
MNYLFDPAQLEVFGEKYYQGSEFSYRYQQNKKLFLKTNFIPFGPICETKAGLANFIQHINSLKYTKTIIELPIILSEKIKNEVTSALEQAGFRKEPYKVQEKETLIIKKGEYKLKKKNRYYARKARKHYKIVLKKAEEISEKDIQDAHKVHIDAADRIGYKKRTLEAFRKLAKNGVLALAYKKDSHEAAGYALSYISQIAIDGDLADKFKKEKASFMQILFAGTMTDDDKLYPGYATYDDLIKAAFNKYNVDIIDLVGAGRERKFSYLVFKMKFSKDFVQLPGRYVRGYRLF